MLRRILISSLVLFGLVFAAMFFIGASDSAEAKINVLQSGGKWVVQVRVQNYTAQNNVTWNATMHTKSQTDVQGDTVIDYLKGNHHVFEFNNATWSIGATKYWLGVSISNQQWFFNNTNVSGTITAFFSGSTKSRLNLTNMSFLCNVSEENGMTNDFISGLKFVNISNCLVKFLNYKGATIELAGNSILKINNSILSGVTISGNCKFSCDNLIIRDSTEYGFYTTNFVSIKNLNLINNKYALVIAVMPMNLKEIQFIDNTYEFYNLFFSKHVNMTDCYFKNGVRFFDSGWNGGHLHLNNNLNVKTVYDGNGTVMKNAIVSVIRNDSIEVFNRTTDVDGLSGVMPLEYQRFVEIAGSATWNNTYTINIYHPNYQSKHIKTSTNRYNGTAMNWTISLNESYVSGLVVAENIVGATGTHEYAWFPNLGLHGEWWVWANYTGTASGGGASLLVHNPNPGNGTHSTNYLQANTVGVKTCVDVSYQNMTVLSEANLGTGNMTEHNGNIDSVTWISSDDYGQTFTIGTNGSAIVQFIHHVDLKLDCSPAGPGDIYTNLTFDLYETSGNFPIGKPLDSTEYRNISSAVATWYSFNFTNNTRLENGVMYALVANISKQKNNDFEWSDFKDNPAYVIDSYIGGSEIRYVGGTWIYPGGYTNLDYAFRVYSWTVGGNISWNHIVNLTFSSNATTTGSWMNYSYQNVVANGTVCILNTNFSENNTDYFWRVNWSTTEISEAGYSIFTFTTSDFRFPLMLKNSSLIVGMSVGGFSGLLFMVFGINRKKKKLL